MRKLAVLVLAAAVLGALFAALTSRGGSPSTAQASSHREAPLISEDPSADNTDTYAFRSPDRPDTVSIISNYIPGEDPAAGPNWSWLRSRGRRRGSGSRTELVHVLAVGALRRLRRQERGRQT